MPCKHLKESSEQLVGLPVLCGQGGWIWLEHGIARLDEMLSVVSICWETTEEGSPWGGYSPHEANLISSLFSQGRKSSL